MTYPCAHNAGVAVRTMGGVEPPDAVAAAHAAAAASRITWNIILLLLPAETGDYSYIILVLAKDETVLS